jgi:hypothetical protein
MSGAVKNSTRVCNASEVREKDIKLLFRRRNKKNGRESEEKEGE